MESLIISADRSFAQTESLTAYGHLSANLIFQKNSISTN